MIEIRPASRDDAQKWLRMREALWPEEDIAELAADVERYFGGTETLLLEVLLAFGPGGDALGFAELSIRPYAEGCSTNRVGYLEGWYVEPAARRRGVGGALVRAAEAWALKQGCAEFASDALLENEVSARAHAALGFDEVERIRCFRKELAIESQRPETSR